MVNDYIVKPFSFREVGGRVSSLLKDALVS
jgi:DNA-binding response OmpR family regulator